MLRRAAIIICCCALTAAPAPLRAGSDAGTTAANFLKIPVAAIPAGLADAYTALVGPDSILYNPAGLGLLSYSAFSGAHSQYVMDIRQEYAAVALHTSFGVFGAAYTSLNSGEIDGYDANDMPTGNFDTTQRMAAVAYAKSWPDFKEDAGRLDPMLINTSWTKITPVTSYRPRSYRVSVGIAAKRVMEDFDGEAASAGALDAGVTVLLPRHLHLGASVQNIGRAQKLYSEAYALPRTLRAGFAKDFHTAGDVMIFTLASDLVKYSDQQAYGATGVEVDVMRMFQLRMGYRTMKDTGSRLTGGFGLNFDRLSDDDGLIKGMRADYAFVDYGDLGATHRIGVQLIW